MGTEAEASMILRISVSALADPELAMAPIFQMTNWRHIREAGASAKRAKLDIAEQVKIYKYIGKMMNWRRRELLQELLNAVKYAVSAGVHLKNS